MTASHEAHKWEFKARFRRHAFGWKSQPAIQRVKQAVTEIGKVARHDPVLAAEGAVTLLERLSPALEHVDSSSGAIGTAVNNAIADLVPIIARAPLIPRRARPGSSACGRRTRQIRSRTSRASPTTGASSAHPGRSLRHGGGSPAGHHAHGAQPRQEPRVIHGPPRAVSASSRGEVVRGPCARRESRARDLLRPAWSKRRTPARAPVPVDVGLRRPLRLPARSGGVNPPARAARCLWISRLRRPPQTPRALRRSESACARRPLPVERGCVAPRSRAVRRAQARRRSSSR